MPGARGAMTKAAPSPPHLLPPENAKCRVAGSLTREHHHSGQSLGLVAPAQRRRQVVSRPTSSQSRRAELWQDLPLTADEAVRILEAPFGPRFKPPADWQFRREHLALALARLTVR